MFILAVLALAGAAFAQEARLSGRIANSDGGPVPGAVVVACDDSASLWFMTSTDAAGGFDLAGLPAGEFFVEVLSPLWRRGDTGQVWGFRPWTGAVTLRAGQRLDRAIDLGKFGLQARNPKTPPPCAPSRPIAFVGTDRLERLLVYQTEPGRPRGLTGQVVLEAFLNPEGSVISLRLLAPSWPPTVDPVLTRAAVEAVREWRYRRPENTQAQVFEFTGQIVVDFAP